MGLLKLTIDRQNKALVSLTGTSNLIPPLFQSNVPTLQISVVDPTGNLVQPYSLVDLNGYSMRVAVGDTPTGTSGGPTPLALQDTFVWNVANKYFSADLALNTSAIDAFIGSAPSKQAYFEVNITGPSGRDTILQTTFLLKAVLDELASIAPNPVDQYFTRAEVLALFAKKVGNPGDRIVFVSADGTAQREMGVNNDKSGIDNLS